MSNTGKKKQKGGEKQLTSMINIKQAFMTDVQPTIYGIALYVKGLDSKSDDLKWNKIILNCMLLKHI